jgi:hypothetical protein
MQFGSGHGDSAAEPQEPSQHCPSARTGRQRPREGIESSIIHI